MIRQSSAHLFVLGNDYHLGDLLWFTAVLAEYRRQLDPRSVLVGCPDRPISRILEHNPLIDEILYGERGTPSFRGSDRSPGTRRGYPAGARGPFGDGMVLHDLRILPIALAMVRQWRRRLPWLYYRDLWLRERGQWLASFLGLGRLHRYRPVLRLVDEDREVARRLIYENHIGDNNKKVTQDPSGLRPMGTPGGVPGVVVLAPHTGRFTLPLVDMFWRKVKGWPPTHWIRLANQLRREGYEPVTLAAPGQAAVPGTRAMIGLPIRQVAGVIERAAALITVESGLWFIAAGLCTPFIIVPWWLPRSVDWAAPMQVPHRLIYRGEDSVEEVLEQFHQLGRHDTF